MPPPGTVLDDAKLLFALRIRDPHTRALVRGRLANNGAAAVTDNLWEMPGSDSEANESHADWWDEELRWLEGAIDARTDVIYIWSVLNGALARTALGGGG